MKPEEKARQVIDKRARLACKHEINICHQEQQIYVDIILVFLVLGASLCLIHYADISDYKDIVLRNWRTFANKFDRINLSKEKFEHGMVELNKTRRKVMHLRDVRSHEAKTLRLYIIPALEKIFQ